MRINRSLFFALSCSLLFVGCDKDDSDKPEPAPIEEPTPEPTPEPGSSDAVSIVTFTPQLSAPTRATDTQFENNDRIGVFAMLSTGDDNRSVIADYGNYADNVAYTYNGSKFTSTEGIQIKEETKLYYTAVYPYFSSCANRFSFDVRSDQRMEGDYKASDLCTASTDATSATEVQLKFNHRLSKIIINLEGDGWTNSNITVRMKNVFTRASVNLNTQSYLGIGERSDVICSSNGTNSYKVIIPPQTINAGEKLFTVSMNGIDYSLDTQTAQDYVSGKVYELKYTLNASGEIVEFTGDINPWNVDERINEVVPEDIQDKMEPYIPIYRGVNPPNIEGTVFVDPFVTVYCEDYGNGGYAPGDIVVSHYIRFSNQSSVYNTIDIEEVSASGSSYLSGIGAFISGTGNNFTAFFNTIGATDGISTRTALVISGTKSEGGINNLKYAFVMVEKGDDPTNHLMKEGVFRVFEDQNYFSEYTSWPNLSRALGSKTNSKTVYHNNK